MPRSYAEEFLPLLYNALEEEIGMYIRTDDTTKLLHTLYDARKITPDDALAEIMIFRIDDQVLYIAKRSAELPE